MNEHKYTAGPWEIHEGAYGFKRGEFSVWPIGASGDGDKRIACWITTEANAKLIAAAPELLDALIYMRRTMFSETSEESIKADAAIAKALQREISEDVF